VKDEFAETQEVSPPIEDVEKEKEEDGFALMPEAEDMTVGVIKSAGLPVIHVAFCVMYGFIYRV